MRKLFVAAKVKMSSEMFLDFFSQSRYVFFTVVVNRDYAKRINKRNQIGPCYVD